MASYDLAEVAGILGVQVFGTMPLAGYRVDSRQVVPGDLFFALPGQKVDGHSFLGDVAARGALAAVVNSAYTGPDYGLVLVKVDDVLAALQALARHHLAAHRAKVVAVTGSVGKTTTKELLLSLLRRHCRVGASRGNYNSQIGLPLTLLNDISDHLDVIVLEMGMTQPGHLKQLLTIAPADVAVLTTVALAHAEHYDTLEDIARTKAEIFTHPKTSLGILSRDIANYDELVTYGVCRKLSFSTSRRDADYSLEADSGAIVVLAEEQRHVLGPTPLPGLHGRHNLLAAIAAARSLGVSWDCIAEAIPHLTLPERRMQTVQKGGILFINDSYNACETSVKAALACLPPAQGRRVAVLGTMPELGKFSDPCHSAVGQYALDYVDYLFCLGIECEPMMATWKDAGRPVQLFTDKRELVARLQRFLKTGDVVLIKGACAKKMWEILDEIQL